MSRSPAFRCALFWVLVVLWAAFIFFMSAHTGSDFSDGEGLVASIRRCLDSMQAAIFGDGVDVISPAAHFVEYVIFGFLMLLALNASGVERHVVLFTIALCALYAITDELHQAFVPGRACDPLDWIVDVCGASLGAFAASRSLAKNESKCQAL